MRILTNKEAEKIIKLIDKIKDENPKLNSPKRLDFYNYKMTLGPNLYKWKVKFYVWLDFKRMDFLYFWESTFVRPFCRHKNLRSEYDYKTDKGYRVCTRCWNKTEDPTIKTSSSGLFSLGSDGAKWEGEYIS